MKLLMLLVVAVGAAMASPAGFLQNTPEVQAATFKFINEYNRLARLAAEAPDINIYYREKNRKDVHHFPAVRQTPAAIQAQNSYSYSTHLGGNHQFQPAAQFRSHAQQQLQQPTRAISQHQPHPRQYRGPFSHTVPAGVHGLPTQVQYTPAVQQARDEHFRALAQAYQSAGRFI